MPSVYGFISLSRIGVKGAFDYVTSICQVRPSFRFHLNCRGLSSSNQTKISKDADVLIIGGGAMGSSAAYFLKSKCPDMKVVVVERDPKVNVYDKQQCARVLFTSRAAQI